MVVKPMCSDICPCPPTGFEEWKSGLDLNLLTQAGRTTKKVSELSGAEVSDYKKNGMNAKVTPFVAAADDASGFATYQDCFEKVLTSVKSTDKKNSASS